MNRRNSHHAGRTLALALSFLLFCGFAAAQADKPAEPSAPPPNSQAQPSDDSGPHFGRELARDSREAAGEEQDENAQFKHSPSVQWVARITGLSLQKAYWLCLLLNFAVVAAFVIWALTKNLPGLFRNRTAQIQQAMEEARRASAEANQRLADIGARLSRLDSEIAAMRDAAEKEALAEEARIQAATEEDARKILQSAEQEIAAAVKSARRDLKAYAASLAVSLAAKQIQVDTASDKALVRDFASQLAADGKSRRSDN